MLPRGGPARSGRGWCPAHPVPRQARAPRARLQRRALRQGAPPIQAKAVSGRGRSSRGSRNHRARAGPGRVGTCPAPPAGAAAHCLSRTSPAPTSRDRCLLPPSAGSGHRLPSYALRLLTASKMAITHRGDAMVHAPGNDTAALETLAAELHARGYEARLTVPDGRPPWLAVINPAATMLAETDMADAEWFWWPWADRIAPAADAAAAADPIARGLALAPAGGGQGKAAGRGGGRGGRG